MREKLAELAHKQWSGWVKSLFEKCEEEELQSSTGSGLYKTGKYILSKEIVSRYNKLMCTKYSDLSENEKEKDRAQADKVIDIMNGVYEEEKSIQLIEDLSEIARNHENNAKRLFRIVERLLEEHRKIHSHQEDLEFDLPEEMDEYKTYMQAADASSALWKIKETFHGRNKWAETNCEFHEEVYELICNIIGEYNISL